MTERLGPWNMQKIPDSDDRIRSNQHICGAAYVSGLQDCIVCDIGGTTGCMIFSATNLFKLGK
jgi:hypothetical protein